MKTLQFILLLPIMLVMVSTTAAVQEDFPYDKNIWPDDLRIRGHVIVCGQGTISESTRDRFFQLASEEDSAIVSIQLGTVDETTTSLKKAFDSAYKFDAFELDAQSTEFPKPLTKALESATGIWISGNELSEDQATQLRSLGPALHKLIGDECVVLMAGASAKMAGRTYTSPAEPNGLQIGEGLNLIPDGLVSTSGSSENRAAISMDPLLVSIDIPADTSIILSGRQIRTQGSGNVEYRLMANDAKPFRTLSVAQPKSRRVNPYRDLIDLTAWRRDAIDRTLATFPPLEPAKPFVENGTLVIVGGGGMPRGLFDEFIEMAGGKDAKLIYVPCTDAETVSESRLVNSWKQRVKSATLFHTKDRSKADSDEEFLAPLKDATGIWFGGGRQWNFVDSYYGTQAHRLMLDVLKRGGVVGGSSAGASIQGEYLARANPVANFDIMAPGYERGMGFLQGVAIDQHFSQRRRQPNMTELANTYPQLLGIGLDEATAIVVRKSTAKVVGNGKVFFYDRNQPVVPGEDDFISLSKGQTFDLAERKVIESDSETDSEK